jgi:predicted transcriptional regulator
MPNVKDRDVRLSKKVAETLYVINEHGPVTIAEVAAKLGISYQAARKRIGFLKKSGFVQCAEERNPHSYSVSYDEVVTISKSAKILLILLKHGTESIEKKEFTRILVEQNPELQVTERTADEIIHKGVESRYIEKLPRPWKGHIKAGSRIRNEQNYLELLCSGAEKRKSSPK